MFLNVKLIYNIPISIKEGIDSMKFLLHNPTKLYFGLNEISSLKNEIKEGIKVLLVYGGGSIKKTGLYDEVMGILKDLKCNVFELSGIEPNPRLSSVNAGIEICKNNSIDFILAVGGGSVIDASKAISIGAKSEHDVWDLIIKKYDPIDRIPLGVILTLAATGSEMNANSVITNDSTNQKVGFAHKPYTFPVFAISDPTYTKSVPKNHTANGIVDTISHLIEQYFNNEDAELVDRFCETSISYMMDIAHDLLNNLHDYKLREGMMYTSMVGLNGSLSVCGFDGATHAIEHSISGIFNIPHGVGLAIITPSWMKYVSRKNPSKVIKLGERVFGLVKGSMDNTEFCDMVAEKFKDFFKSLGVKTSLSECNINMDSIDALVENTFVSGDSIGMYIELGRKDVREILEMSM